MSEMGVVQRKTELFENIVCLRHAGRAAPRNRDIAAVRASLESELGETVSQRLAASLLGVSHTALGRWVRSGDLPTVFTASGRREMPVRALLELRDAVSAQREDDRRGRHVLETVIADARRRAAHLRDEDLAVRGRGETDPHRRAGLRSLAYHRVIAARLNARMVDEALYIVWKWRDQDKLDASYADQWEALLNRPLDELRKAIGRDDERMRDLRQNSPFAGMLSEVERRQILQKVA